MNVRIAALALPALAGLSLSLIALPSALAQEGLTPAGEASVAAAPAPKVGVPLDPRAQRRGLVRVFPAQIGQPLEAEPFDEAVWEEELRQSDLGAREASFDRAVAALAHDSALRAWLTEIAEGGDELAWTARLALKAAERERGAGLDELERALEEMTQRLAPGWNPKLEPLAIPFPSLLVPGARLPGAASQSKRVEVQNGSDGWTIRITENVDGEDSVRELRGDTLEEILEANPELKSEVGITGSLLGPGFTLRIGSPHDETFDFEELFGELGERPGLRVRALAPRPLVDADPIRTDIFGVVARPATEEEGDGGLYVRSTVPGTIAPLLGIVPGDILLSMNDVEMRALEDITAAMAQRADDGHIEAEWRDGQGRRRTGTWRP